MLFPAFSQHLLELCIGNLFLTAFFIIADQRIAPGTKGGRWIIGVLTGVLAFLARYFSPFPDGLWIAVILGNVCSGLVDNIILKFKYRTLPMLATHSMTNEEELL